MIDAKDEGQGEDDMVEMARDEFEKKLDLKQKEMEHKAHLESQAMLQLFGGKTGGTEILNTVVKLME